MPRLVVLAVLACATRTAHAQDAFEIQVYDVETAVHGDPGLEAHLNQHVIEHAPDETHLTLEPHYGLTDWAELGGYFQTAMTSTGELDYAGVKLRLKVRVPHRVWMKRIGLALNGELSDVPARFEPNVYGSELRPIVDLIAGRLYASVNPIVTTDLGGTLRGLPQFEPAAKITVKACKTVAIGVEGYGAFGPFDALGSERVTRLFGVVDVTGAWWDLNVGAGWTWGLEDHPIVKLIVGIHPQH